MELQEELHPLEDSHLQGQQPVAVRVAALASLFLQRLVLLQHLLHQHHPLVSTLVLRMLLLSCCLLFVMLPGLPPLVAANSIFGVVFVQALLCHH